MILVIDTGSTAVTSTNSNPKITAPRTEVRTGSERKPAHMIRLGAHISADGTRGAPAERKVLDHFAKLVGGRPDIIETFKSPSKNLLTPVETANLEAEGGTPLVTLEPFFAGGGERAIPLRQISAGDWDADFRRQASEAAEFPGEVMVRFAEEMNGDWYGWSGHPAAFVAAWRHVVTVFRHAGATNVRWVWSPNINHGYPFDRYFPGEAWVDYVGLDGYNWGTEGPGADHWSSFSSIFLRSYEELTALSSRPVIIAETASGSDGGSKARWIKRAYLREIPKLFPRVVAVIWFDYDKEEDWRVNSSRSSLKAFREVVASPLYRMAGP